MATQTAATESALPVLIVGAGSCGLAIANGLKRAGVPYRVFEKDASVKLHSDGKERDWAVACHWSSPILAELIGPEKWSRIMEVQVDPNTPTQELDIGKVLNGATGEIINELPFPKFYRFLRSRLRALMAEDIDISYGKKLSSLSYATDGSSVTAYFEDGTSEKGRLIIGADGSNSKVRRLLVGAERAKLKQLPFNATFINASFTREQALFLRSYHPLATIIVHPDNMVSLLALLDAPESDKPEGWRFCFYISWQASVEEQEAEAAVMGVKERLLQAKGKSKAYADPLKSAHDWLPDDHQTVYWTRNMNWDPSLPEHAWDNHEGRVTLAGDAAHAMTYHRGQGLNHALDDADKIVKLLSRSSDRSQSNLIDIYETEMRARSGEEVRLSEMNSCMLHDFSQLKESPLLKSSIAKGSTQS